MTQPAACPYEAWRANPDDEWLAIWAVAIPCHCLDCAYRKEERECIVLESSNVLTYNRP